MTDSLSQPGIDCPLKKSLGREETSAGPDDSPGANPKKQITLSRAHPIPGVQPCGKRLLCPPSADKVGAARLTHATPKVSSRTRVEAVVFIFLLAINIE